MDPILCNANSFTNRYLIIDSWWRIYAPLKRFIIASANGLLNADLFDWQLNPKEQNIVFY